MLGSLNADESCGQPGILVAQQFRHAIQGRQFEQPGSCGNQLQRLMASLQTTAQFEQGRQRGGIEPGECSRIHRQPLVSR